MVILLMKGLIIIKNVDNMITQKDLLYLEDLFNWHQNSINKLNYYEEILKESDSKKMISTILDMHETYQDDIIGFLEDN